MLNLSKCCALFACAALLAACSSAPRKPASAPSSSASGSGPRYYKDDGPGDNVPANLDSIPDATPKREVLNRFANRPYTVLGRDYVPATELKPYREQGIASWYGRKFHNQKTAIGETYDMYGMTAAHPTLPLPSYARVTNVATGKSVIVRVNDRGPFLYGRVIDLSYAAAHRIGVAQKGSGEVIVEAVIPGGMVIATPLPAVMQPPVVPSPTLAQAPVQVQPLPTPPPIQGTTLPVVPVPGESVMAAVASARVEPMVQAVPATAAGPSGSYVVQLGAFRDYANAKHFLGEAKDRLGNAGVDPQIRQLNGLWRVYVGPYPDRGEARQAAERLTSAYGVAAAISPH